MLKELDLSYLNMSFVLASSLSNLSSSLSSLRLSNCALQGEYFEYISIFRRLNSLDLSNNYDLSIETITFSMLVRNLTMLRAMDLSYVNLSLVSPTSFLNLSSSLSSLSLSNCQLSGKFPGALLQRPNLQLLDLGGNEDITEFLPPTSNWSDSLRYLSLYYTKIPVDFISNLNSLEKLDLKGCNFVGSNLALLGNLTQLNELYLSPDNFKGIEIPYSFGNLVKLTTLDLLACNFSGQIPSSLGNLKQLSYLSLNDNNLSGHIPSSLGNLTQLSVLYLFNNSLSGSIPNSFENLTQLKRLDLSSNELIGPIPSQLGRISSLTFLDFANNFLNETIPISLFTLPSLYYLNIDSNLLTGQIPQFHQYTPSLVYINLRRNKLNGPIPSSISKLVDLEVLILSSNNKFSGQISSSICKLQNLRILDLSNNSFHGSIPKCFEKFSHKLKVLDLGMNYLNGTIHPTFSKGSSLRYINFYSNELQGQVPLSLINCKNLEFLDLGDNNIVDKFPFFLGALPKLEVLVLRSNKLHGLLKKFSPKYSFPSLQIFDLSNNNFSGPLPSEYFDHLEAMMVMVDTDPVNRYMGIQKNYYYSYDYSVELAIKGSEIELGKIQTIFTTIDFSQNKFTGKIPNSIGKLKSLIHLNLSHNYLQDNVPPSLGNLTNLESLDLSSNFLVGRIPEQLLDMEFLAVFNISYNQLEGPIPHDKLFGTFDNSSYEGNLGLCGFPLTKECDHGGETRQLSPSKEAYSESDENGFGWEAIVVGYGCGVIFGVGIGYFLFKRRKDSSFVRMVELKAFFGE